MEQTKIFFIAVIFITAVPLIGHAGVIPGPTGNLPSNAPSDTTSIADSSLVDPVSPFDIMPEGPSSRLSAAALRESVEILCDPIFAGRGTGTDGARYASEWIRDMFVDAGLMPYEENWYHEFPLASGVDSRAGSGAVSGRGRNVVGFLPGKSGKWIVIGAYYDGLGEIGGKIYPGADSNASGVAALIALAHSVRRDCRDGLIFVAFDARSRDYAGARAMLSALRAGGQSVRMMVSLDILGSTLAPVNIRNPRSLMALGGKPWAATLRKSASLGRIDMYFDYYKSESFTNLFYNKIGDQTVFMKAGIPSVVFTSGITLNTNKVTDTPETLDYEALRARVLCISRWLSLTAGAR